jgi:hypothetical protein
MNRMLVMAAALLLAAFSIPDAFGAEHLKITPLAERKVAQLPAGELYWRIDTFPTAADARAAAGPWSLVAEAAGKAWLFTLGGAGGATPGAVRVAEVGPIPRVKASEYLLRINEARGAPGSITSIHSHPGSEAFFVLTGEQSIRGPSGMVRLRAGQAEAGGGADRPMQVSSSGEGDLHALVMFVVDATRPFSSPAAFP